MMMNNPKTKQTDYTFLVILILGLISVLLFSGFTAPQSSEFPAMTVYAAAGTMSAMQQVADQYEKQTGQKVVLNFASSSILAKQIEAGADFDVFISANPKWMSYVQEKSLIQPETRQNFLSDKLVLITQAKSALSCGDNDSLAELLRSADRRIAIGDAAHVPCGMYAKEALTKLHCWDAIQDRIIPATSVRAAQQYVESGQAELGIVYYAGASQSDKIKILSIIDQSLYSPIQFSLACSPQSSTAAGFVDFMHQRSSTDIFVRAGFTPFDLQGLPVDDTPLDEPILDINVWQTLSVSLKVAATCTLMVAAPGVLLGYVLARKSFPGRSLVNAFVHLPLVIPPVVTGYLALSLLGKNSLIGKWLDEVFGISIAFSWAGAVVVSALMGLPLLVRSVKTAIEMIDRRYAMAADTLGVGPVRTFFTITIPLAAPGILAGLVLAFARCLGEFGATATFAGNIPGKTQTLSLAIYSFTQIPGAESAAMRLVCISILLSFAAMLGSEWLTQRMKHLAETNQ